MNSKEENSEAFVPITAKNSASPTLLLEMRLSVSPATPFSVASLPNHTKMFELVHVITSMDDFDPAPSNPPQSIKQH